MKLPFFFSPEITKAECLLQSHSSYLYYLHQQSSCLPLLQPPVLMFSVNYIHRLSPKKLYRSNTAYKSAKPLHFSRLTVSIHPTLSQHVQHNASVVETGIKTSLTSKPPFHTCFSVPLWIYFPVCHNILSLHFDKENNNNYLPTLTLTYKSTNIMY